MFVEFPSKNVELYFLTVATGAQQILIIVNTHKHADLLTPTGYVNAAPLYTVM